MRTEGKNFIRTPLFSHFTLVLIFKRINLNVCSGKLNTPNLFRQQCEEHPRDDAGKGKTKKLRRSHLRVKLSEIEIYNDEILWCKVTVYRAFLRRFHLVASLRRINCIKEPFSTLLLPSNRYCKLSLEVVKEADEKVLFIIRPRLFRFKEGWKLWGDSGVAKCDVEWEIFECYRNFQLFMHGIFKKSSLKI